MIVFTVPEDDKGGLAFMTDLYRRYSRLMYATARRCVSSGQDCEDIVQDAVESLCNKLHTLMDLPAPALPVYITHTVKNQARNFIRHQAVVQKHIVEWNGGCLDSREAPLPPPETLAALSGNVSANLLGLGNAATPLGIRAARRMAEGCGGTASNELCTLVVLNTASIQLLPTTVAGVRAALGAESAFDITLTLRPEDGYTGASLSVQRYDQTEKETTGTTILFWEIAALEVAS